MEKEMRWDEMRWSWAKWNWSLTWLSYTRSANPSPYALRIPDDMRRDECTPIVIIFSRLCQRKERKQEREEEEEVWENLYQQICEQTPCEYPIPYNNGYHILQVIIQC